MVVQKLSGPACSLYFFDFILPLQNNAARRDVGKQGSLAYRKQKKCPLVV